MDRHHLGTSPRSLCRLSTTRRHAKFHSAFWFSVQHLPSRLEFCGSSLNHLFAQRRNLLRPRFWKMLSQINRFNREAIETLASKKFGSTTVGDYVRQKNYGADFLNFYLVPMSSA